MFRLLDVKKLYKIRTKMLDFINKITSVLLVIVNISDAHLIFIIIYNRFWFLTFKFITKLVIVYKFLFLGTIITSVVTFGINVARICNETTSTSQTTLNSPRDIILFKNNTLFVADGSNHIFAFQLDNRTARTVKTFDS